MAIVVRIVMMMVAYVLACGAASTVLTIGLLTPYRHDPTLLSLHAPAAMWLIVAFGAVVVGAVAVLPALLIIALAEGFGWRSVVLYGVLGGMLALVLAYGLDFAGYIGGHPGYQAHEREVLAAAGIVGGLVYWLFAGRKAGLWQ